MLSGRQNVCVQRSRQQPFGFTLFTFSFVSDLDPTDINGREEKHAYQIFKE